MKRCPTGTMDRQIWPMVTLSSSSQSGLVPTSTTKRNSQIIQLVPGNDPRGYNASLRVPRALDWTKAGNVCWLCHLLTRHWTHLLHFANGNSCEQFFRDIRTISLWRVFLGWLSPTGSSRPAGRASHSFPQWPSAWDGFLIIRWISFTSFVRFERHWFCDMQGLAMGVVVGGFGGGAFIFNQIQVGNHKKMMLDKKN